MSSERLGLALLVMTAVYYAVGVLWRHSAEGRTFPAYDFYGLFYPNLVHAGRSLREGSGLLWNSYQACGAPFFANSQVGLLYPTNVLFALLDREVALIANVIVHLSIAGGGTFLLARTLGLGIPAALCAALAFQLNSATLFLATSAPIHINPFAWLPVAMWCTELLVRVPQMRRAVVLAVVLTLQALPGFHQIGFFTYQLIAVRIVWAVLAGHTPQPLRLMVATGVGLTLPFFLAAVQLVPSIEMARASIRTIPLTAADIGPDFTWHRLPTRLVADLTYPGSLVIVALAALALVAPTHRRPWGAGFFLVVATTYFVLSLGPGTLLYDVYEQLPLAKSFRGAGRLRWVTSFALALLVGLSAESILRGSEMQSPWWLRARAGILLAAALLCVVFASAGVRRTDAVLMTLLAATAVAAHWPRSRAVAAVVLPSVIVTNCVLFGQRPLFGLVWGDVYGMHAEVFAGIRQRMTAQDRILIVGGYPALDLMPKSASLLRMPSTYDYEAQTPLYYADFFTFMRTGRSLQRVSEWHWLFDKMMPEPLRRPLFDLVATRYLFVDPALDRTVEALGSGLRLVQESGGLRVYENLQALPRARYVPHIAVLPPEQILPRLADSVDVRHVVLVTQPPRSGFLGGKETIAGSAEVTEDRAERVTVRVSAPAAGFLFLADAYFPGWSARVNGREQEIVRANHAFRLVEVPAGDSEVIFTYRPLSLRIGAAITLVTCVTVAAWWLRSTRAAAAQVRHPA